VSDLAASTDITDPAMLGDAELQSLLQCLEREERSVSTRRNTLHRRIDFVGAGGFASNDPERESLAELQAAEVEISEHRIRLHKRIDALRAERSRRRI
jgi:hypothetical protein